MAIWLFYTLAVLASTPLVTPWFWSALRHGELDCAKIAKIFAVDIFASALFMLLVVACSNDYTLFGCFYFIAIVFGISQFSNAFYYYEEDDDSRSSYDLCLSLSFIASLLCVVFVIGVMIASGVYNNNNPENLNINKYEEELSIQDVDITASLEKLNISTSFSLKGPIQRNGNWLYYLDGSGDLPGFVIVSPSGEAKLLKNTILYKASNTFIRATRWEAINALPGKIFWTWSLQWDPETNELFHVATYGHHRFLRAGRIVEGLVEVSLHSGKVKTYSLEELPKYLSNYSD